ncbi:MAG: PspC domain-containing protein [Propionibacteriaceae bacterium]|nr:PspC domain-containing protein [Propionibacteriaceae bacterium]
MRGSSQLRRNPATGRIAGVAAGLSDFFGIDVTLIRVLLVAASFFTSGGVLVGYILAWMLLPATNRPNQPPTRQPARRGGAWTIAIIALIAAIVVFANDHMSFLLWLVPVAIALLIWRRVRGRGSWRAKREFEQARLAWQRRLDEQRAQSAPPANLGGNPFQIGSFYPQSPTYPPGQYPTQSSGQAGYSDPDQRRDNPTSGFQIQ